MIWKRAKTAKTIFAFLCLCSFSFSVFGEVLTPFSKLFFAQATICKCNHSSAKEVHSSKEDESFRATELKKKRSFAQSLPNCHSKKAKEVHLCSCKKQKSQTAFKPAFEPWNTFLGSNNLFVNFQTLYSFSPRIDFFIHKSLEEIFIPPKIFI